MAFSSIPPRLSKAMFYWWAEEAQKDRAIYINPSRSILAERVGFEPTVPLTVRLISSQVHSTTLPPLRDFGPIDCYSSAALRCIDIYQDSIAVNAR
jgi:hypothetical protein